MKNQVYEKNNASSETILPLCARFEIATKRTSIVKYSPAIQVIPNEIDKLFLYLNLNVTTDCYMIYMCRMNNRGKTAGKAPNFGFQYLR